MRQDENCVYTILPSDEWTTYCASSRDFDGFQHSNLRSVCVCFVSIASFVFLLQALSRVLPVWKKVCITAARTKSHGNKQKQVLRMRVREVIIMSCGRALCSFDFRIMRIINSSIFGFADKFSRACDWESLLCCLLCNEAGGRVLAHIFFRWLGRSISCMKVWWIQSDRECISPQHQLIVCNRPVR